MAENWTGGIVATMHMHKIKQSELAQEMGLTFQYVSMVLNEKRQPKGMKERMEAAIDAIVERRRADQK